MRGKFVFGSPFIELEIDRRKVAALVDTGFNGELMLPLKMIDEFGFKEMGLTDYLSASGDRNIAKVYNGKIKMFDEDKDVYILASELNFIVAGMELFHFCKILIERHEDLIEIEKTKKFEV